MKAIKHNKRKLTEFGVWVKKRLIELNMDQKQLAALLGVSESYLTDVLRGSKKGLKYIGKINKVLAITKKETG
ncbi:helix-turn-helix domain-containing protein [Alkaliphilus crotonatoxidans]